MNAEIICSAGTAIDPADPIADFKAPKDPLLLLIFALAVLTTAYAGAFGADLQRHLARPSVSRISRTRREHSAWPAGSIAPTLVGEAVR